MAVYVDESIFPYRGQLYCHVWADSVEELHAAAQAAGLKREWFQCPPKASWEHYDCAPRIRSILVRHGAIEKDRYGAGEWQALKLIQSENPELVAIGHRKLEMYRSARER